MSGGRRPLVGVMGAGEGAPMGVLRLAEELGEALTQRGWAVLSGGRPRGVMAAVSRGAQRCPGHLVVGVLPEPGPTAAVDVAVFTGLGQARNVINVLSADVVVVCGPGGAGTASEACHALKAGRPLILLAVPELWAHFFGSLGAVDVVADVPACCAAIEARLPSRKP